MHAEGAGQVDQPHREDQLHGDAARIADLAGRRAASRGRARRQGPRLARPPARASGFVVRRIADAALYDVVDTSYRTAAAVVVVDLGTVPTYTLAELHALLPEVQIVGLTTTPAQGRVLPAASA